MAKPYISHRQSWQSVISALFPLLTLHTFAWYRETLSRIMTHFITSTELFMYSHRLLTLFLGLLACAPALFAQTYFSRHYGEDTDNGKALVQTDDGGFLTLGYANSSASDYQLQLNRFNAAGDLLWTKEYGTAALDYAGGMIRTKNDKLILCGSRTIPFGPPGSTEVYLICTDLSGNVLWETVFGKTSGAAAVNQVMETPEGDLVAVGTSVPPGAGPQNFIAKFSEDGALRWEKTFGAPNGSEELYDVVVTPDGYYTMAGYASLSANSTEVNLITTDTSGQVLWKNVLVSGVTYTTRALLSPAGGGFLLAGNHSVAGSNPEVLLIRTDPDGNTLWQRQYPVAGRYTTAYDAVEVPGEGFVITGVIKVAPNTVGHRVYLLRVDTDGNPLWEREFEIEPPNGLQTSSAGYAIIRTSDGGFAITGDWFNGVRKELILIKTDAAGILASPEPASPTVIKCFPNPASHEIVLTSEGLDMAIQADVFASDGRLALRQTLLAPQQTINVALPRSVTPGLYTVVLYDRSGSFYRKKVVVN